MKLRPASGSGARSGGGGGGGKSGFKTGGSRAGGSGSGSAPGRGRNNFSRNKPHTGRNSRDKKKWTGGSGNRSNSKERKEDDGAKKGEPLCFLDFWQAGPMREAVAAVSNAGLDIDIALRAVSLKTPARITKCLSSWHKITDDKWVLNVAEK